MSDEEKADFLEKLLADTDRLIELARSIRKHRDEEWLAELRRWHDEWRKETKHFSPTLSTCIERMRQWAKGEG